MKIKPKTVKNVDNKAQILKQAISINLVDRIKIIQKLKICLYL